VYVLQAVVLFSTVSVIGDTPKTGTLDKSKVTTVQATVTAIDQTDRMVTLKGSQGKERTIHVPDSVKKFSSLKVGDVITARYIDGLIFHVMQPGDTRPKGTGEEVITPNLEGRAGGTIASQETAEVTVLGIDPKVPSLTLKTEDGRTISYMVKDSSRIKNLKVGDRIVIVYTEAVMLSVDPPATAKKK
jgi:hypothetical protein